MKDLFIAFFIGIVIILMYFAAYLFYFADCRVVKHYYYLVHTPGRCLE
jgi:hypothetical protein